MDANVSFEIVVFYLLLIDAVGANPMSWIDGERWYQKH